MVKRTVNVVSRNNDNKWKKRIENIVIALVVIAGLALFFKQPIRNMIIANRTNSMQVNKFSAKQLKDNDKNAKGDFDLSDVKPISFDDILSGQANPNGQYVIGGIAVPDVQINLPIFKGIGESQISYGAGTMKPNEVMGEGNYALASHRVNSYNMSWRIANREAIAQTLLFHPLERVTKGMPIYITNREYVYKYKVTDVESVSPDHGEVIDDIPGKKLITLVTCAEHRLNKRVIVHGKFVKKYAYNKAPKKAHKAFQMKYNTWQW
jgi:sortase A